MYPRDGNSVAFAATHGCPPSEDSYCDGDHGGEPWDCVYHREHLKEGLQAQQSWGNGMHNEVVLDIDSISPDPLPHSVLAFFHEGDIGTIQPIHRTFLREFGMEERECPLVALNLAASGDVFS